MIVTPYQIVAPLISLIAITYAWNLVFRQKKTLWEAGLWTIFWGFIAAISIYPDSLNYLTLLTGIRDRENAVLITSIGILFFIVFYMVMRLEELERRQTKFVRKIALRDAGLDKEKTQQYHQKHEDNSSH